MSKIILKLAGFLTLFVLLLGGVAQAAGSGTATSSREQASTAVQPTSETRAILVGGLSFVLMIGAAGTVLWYTARGRHSAE